MVHCTLLARSPLLPGVQGLGEQASPTPTQLGQAKAPWQGRAACAQAAFHTPHAGLRFEPAGEHQQGGQGYWAGSAGLEGGAGGTSELLIGSILALSFAMQATLPPCLWGPVKCKGEGALSSSDLTNLHPSLPPPPQTSSLWVRLCGQIDMI